MQICWELRRLLATIATTLVMVPDDKFRLLPFADKWKYIMHIQQQVNEYSCSPYGSNKTNIQKLNHDKIWLQ